MDGIKMLQFPFFTLPSLFRFSLDQVLNSVSGFCCWFKMRFSQLTLSTLVTSVAATNLYVSSYSGNITTLKLSRDSYGSYSLSATAVNEGCSPSASWLTKDEGNGIVYCVDEGFTSPNGTISSFSTSPAGDLTQLDHHLTLGGPVSSVVYNGGEGVAVAH